MFQSLIWVACPTGRLFCRHFHRIRGFNPSYGLHALRAATRLRQGYVPEVSIPHMGCMPYGLGAGALAWRIGEFQSLIWVACPTGAVARVELPSKDMVSIPHMGCMPYGLEDARQFADSGTQVSIPHMGCMPYGHLASIWRWRTGRFQSLIWVACPTGNYLIIV